MARAHYQMAIKNYNDRYVQSMKFYFEDSTTENYCETKYVNENETEEQKRNFGYMSAKLLGIFNTNQSIDRNQFVAVGRCGGIIPVWVYITDD